MGPLPRCLRSASLPGLGREQPAGPLMTGEQGETLEIEEQGRDCSLCHLCS